MPSRKSPPTSTAAQLKAFLQTRTITPPATVSLHVRFRKNVKTYLFTFLPEPQLTLPVRCLTNS